MKKRMRCENIDMKYNYVIFATDYDLYRYTFRDAINRDNVKFYADIKELFNPVEKILYRLHFSYRLKKLVNLPYKGKWNQIIAKKIDFNDDKPICFIWFWHFANIIENGFVEYARKKWPNSKHVFFFGDAKNLKMEEAETIKKKMDAVFVFDKKIAEANGAYFFPHVYSDVINNEKDEAIYDICFVGIDKGRRELVEKIAKKCVDEGLKIAFYVRGVKDVSREENIEGLDCGIKLLSYAETMDVIKNSRCLLELKVGEFDSCSLRVQEAVLYRKKILTNNPRVFEMPCCANSPYISVFSDVDDVDFEFLKRRDNVDYRYNGEYSPVKFLEYIEGMF